MDSPLASEEAALDVGANILVACTITTDTQLLYEGRSLFERFRETTEKIVHYQSLLDDQRRRSKRINRLYRQRRARRKHTRDALVRDLVERLYEDGVCRVYVGGFEDISAAWLVGWIKFRGEQLGYSEGSFARLFDALVDSVGREQVETGARDQLGIGDGTVESLIADVDGSEKVHEVDAVVVMAMPNALEALTGYPCAIYFQGTVWAVVSIPKRLIVTYWLTFVDDAPFGVLIEHMNFIPPCTAAST